MSERLKPIDDIRFARWEGDLSLPYFFLPSMRLRCDGSSFDGAAYLMLHGKPWGVAYYQAPEITNNELRQQSILASLQKFMAPTTEAIEALRASWNAYILSNLWC